MQALDTAAILRKISEDRHRMRALGISEERERDYYSSLSIECSDREQDEQALRTSVDGLNLSEEDRTFVLRVLEAGDGR